MRTIPLAELVPEPSSVFLDNVALCSADRILNGSYESVRDNELFRVAASGNRATAATLVTHDLVNLSIVLESMVCFDQIITNADYVNRWNQDIESTSLRYLDDVVVATSLSKAERWDAESSIVLSPDWMRAADVGGADDLAYLVARANHDDWSTPARGVAGRITSRI